METLKPVEVSEFYIQRISSGMRQYFWDNIFAQIFVILAENNVINSKKELIEAIRSGKVYYSDGAFRGKFNNKLADTLEKMGAKYKYGAYYIERQLIPADYLQAIGIMEARSAAKLTALSKYLLALNNDDVQIERYIGKAVESMFKKLSVDLFESAKVAEVPTISLGYVVPDVKVPRAKAKDIEKYWADVDKQRAKYKLEGEDEALQEYNKRVYEDAPKLSIDEVALNKESQKVAEDYVYNMQYWVKNWEVKNIIKTINKS